MAVASDQPRNNQPRPLPKQQGAASRPYPSASATGKRPTIEGLLSLVLTVTSLAVVVTCSAAARQHAPPEPMSSQARWPSPPPSLVPASPSIETAAADPGRAVEPEQASPLSRFFEKATALAEGRRQDHLRIAWLGDSHTAADLWTHAVRQALQERFGNGGPGFFHLGLKNSRHSQVKLEVHGSWRRQPGQPSRTEPYADGVFGLGGVRAIAKEGAVCKARLYSGTVAGNARWSLYYRLPRGASFQLKLAEHSERLAYAAGTDSAVQELTLEAPPEAQLLLRQLSGRPEFFGAIVEGTQPGVVLHTLGIDGARARTPLAWQLEAWERELARRPLDLVVLAYGTNEVFESHAASRYVPDYQSLMQRIRRAQPLLECLMIGPTDVLQGEGQSHPRVAEISDAERLAADSLGCLYIGAHELMGGPGSFAEWQTTKPSLAGGDGVHLTVSGYRELGALTSDFLLTQYERFVRVAAEH